VFLSPIIAGVAGNSASQVMTMTVRALFAGSIYSGNKLYTVQKEATICLLCGVLIGLAMFIISYLFWKSMLFSFIILFSMSLNLSISGLVGAGIPIILSSFKKDPASSSSIMNVVTDVCSYLIFFGISWIFRDILMQELVLS
jgi:magnesium transporter